MKEIEDSNGMPIGAPVAVDGALVIGQEIRAVMVRGVLQPEMRYQFRLELAPVAIASSGSEPGPARWTEWMTVQQGAAEELVQQWLTFLRTEGHLAHGKPSGSSVN